ncbi:uncharacterized protein CIMG_05631 [Coccidioides immitis RS]|uniref:Uncharacterized protein n=4 Tax=Coccidioides immitis TaxID=5501 RepID=A0A0E1RYY1_COCIM|nr:uncharacterized protein CIMG_05631 [Coccidioides immitis RS]EAS34607.1 hypothetical protein CIMG_05631 [Coccidioides immitis RS]KMP05777.1 hypothetical protein CIRG_05458 [Coccidioides immitis RMSCC 2394]KMU80818.1 hypothetical protein CISG_08943 [Coccidioides immitis RMSCC 3703]KMU87009.1 hypothetical protein CIHG_04949 [Coccidioides immitis H538.4]
MSVLERQNIAWKGGPEHQSAIGIHGRVRDTTARGIENDTGTEERPIRVLCNPENTEAHLASAPKPKSIPPERDPVSSGEAVIRWYRQPWALGDEAGQIPIGNDDSPRNIPTESSGWLGIEICCILEASKGPGERKSLQKKER